MTFIVKRGLPLLVILALIVPTVAAQKQQDEEVDTSGWVLYQGEDSYVLVPPDWIDLSDPEIIAQTIEAAGDVSPELDSILSTAGPQIEAGLIDIFLVEPISTSSLNVIALDVGSELPLTMLEPMMTAQYEELGAESITVEPVEIAAGTALRSEYTLPLTNAFGGEYITVQIQYILAQDNFMYVLTLGTEQSVYDEFLPILEAVATTFGIGQAPADLVAASEGGVSGQKPPSEVIEPNVRGDVVRHDTPWMSIIAPPDWFSARDGAALTDFVAANGGHPQADLFFETLSGDVADGTYQYVLVQPQDLAYMTLIATDLGADIPVSTFQDSQEATVKGDAEIEFIDGDIVPTPSGDALIIEVVRPIRGDVEHHELRVFWVQNETFIFMILAAPEEVYADYEQVFIDIINTVSFPTSK